MTRAEWKLFWTKVDWSRPTSHIAKQLRLKIATVSCARRRLAPKTVNKTRIKRRQTFLDSILLSEWLLCSNKELARKYRRAASGIAWHRESRKLPPSPGKPLSELRYVPFRVWKEKTNRQIADETGSSMGAVASYRLKHGFPASPKSILKFSSLHNVPDGDWKRKTSVEIAADTGYSVGSVKGFRRYHGKPGSPYLSRFRKIHTLKDRSDRFFETNSDRQIAALLSTSRGVVRRARKLYGKPPGPMITGPRRHFNPFPMLRMGELVGHITKQKSKQ